MDRDGDQHRIAMFEALVETASEPLFALDETGAIAVVNDAFRALSGYDRETLAGRSLTTLVHPEEREEWQRRLQFLRNDETTATESWVSRLVTKNGTTVDIEWQCSVVGAGNTAAVVGCARDVRGGQQREQKLKILNRALRHNIRNQMNIIISNAEHLQRIDDEGYRAAATKIAEIGENVVNISDKARKAQQHLDIPPDDDCDQELVGAAETVRQQFDITYPDATLETDLPEEVHAVAPPSLTVALTELVENAIVHHPSGNGPVMVRVRPEDQHAVVTVEDECEPIPEQVTETIRHGSEGPLSHNDGLGLWLVRWIVEPVGGTMSFDRRDDDSGNAVTLQFARPRQ